MGKKFLTVLLCLILALCGMPAGAAEDDARVEILNGAELESASPQSQVLDEYLDDLLVELLDDDMDTYEQVRACYDYLVETVRYGSHMNNLGAAIGDTTCRAIYNAYGEVEGFGAVALSARVGMCNAYASAFILMARKIGLDAYLVRGSTRRSPGSYTYHEWAEIEIDDTVYLFDPQLEQSLTEAGLAAYTVFCVTYEQVPSRYIKN